MVLHLRQDTMAAKVAMKPKQQEHHNLRPVHLEAKGYRNKSLHCIKFILLFVAEGNDRYTDAHSKQRRDAAVAIPSKPVKKKKSTSKSKSIALQSHPVSLSAWTLTQIHFTTMTS